MTVTHRLPMIGRPVWLLVLALVSWVVAMPGATPSPLRGQFHLPLPNSLSQPLAFIANAGQMDSAVLFQTHLPGGSLFFTADTVVLSGSLGSSAASRQPSTVRLHFVGGNTETAVSAGTPLPGKINYFIGNDPAQWHTGLPTYASITYRELYPGVELHYNGTARALKGTYILAPGADPSLIRWQYEGASQVTLDETSGNLLVTLSPHHPVILSEQAPIAWQTIGGKQVHVPARYILLDENGRLIANHQAPIANPLIAFTFPDGYNPAYPLTIDPVLDYSTYLGGTGADYGYEVAVDSYGSAYVVGYTYSTDFPTAGALQSESAGSADVFISKFSPSGDALVYSTYLGGSHPVGDFGYGITVDGLGNAYVTGETFSSDFPTVSPLYPDSGGGQDAFVAKLSADGGTLLYSTYLGGSAEDVGSSIAVDGLGTMYLTGWTYSLNFPTAAPQNGTRGGPVDAFVTKVVADGSELVYSTFLGGNSCCAGTDGSDKGSGIAVDDAGNAYITGFTNSTNFPLMDPLQDNCIIMGTCADAFITKFNADGSAHLFSTYWGGSGFEAGTGIALDGEGNVYLTGTTASTDFPTENPAQAEPGGGKDAFVTKLLGDGSAVIYSTYLGGSGDEADSVDAQSGRIAIDSLGNAYVTGSTLSGDFPVISAPPGTHGSERESFLTKVSADGSSWVYSMYLGGSDVDFGQGVAVDTLCAAYVTGYTLSDDFPTADPFQSEPPNEYLADAFLARMSEACGELPTGGLSGAVTDSDGLPLGILVEAFRFNGTGWDHIATTSTDVFGNYEFPTLLVGTYRLFFLDPMGGAEWFDDAATFAAATDVMVTADTITPDIDVELDLPSPPLVEIGGTVTVGIDPATGNFLVSARIGGIPPANDVMIVTTTVTCEGSGTPESVNVAAGTLSFPMAPTAPGSDEYRAEILIDNDLFFAGDEISLDVVWVCSGQVFSHHFGILFIIILWDPSGLITDAATGAPIPGAVVVLYKVPGWQPRTSPEDVSPNRCESNDSKPPEAAWSQPAPTHLGVPVNPEVNAFNGIAEFAPPINPLLTNDDGRYGWDVVTGCWYVVVYAQGYETKVSPVVGVPPAVTDLDLTLTPLPQNRVFLPVAIR